MADARRRDAWHHTSNLLAMLVNCHRDPTRSPRAKPDDHNPYARKRVRAVKMVGIKALESVFFPHKRKR